MFGDARGLGRGRLVAAAGPGHRVIGSRVVPLENQGGIDACYQGNVLARAWERRRGDQREEESLATAARIAGGAETTSRKDRKGLGGAMGEGKERRDHGI